VKVLLIFDASEYLNCDKAVAEYLIAILEENDPGILAATFGNIARERGMSEIASGSGIGREALYKALKADAPPCLAAIARVCQDLGNGGFIASPKK
jgi:probable addiction module antidote protein